MGPITEYNLGTARGKLEIDYDGSSLRQGIVDLDAATGASGRFEEQNDETTRSLRESERQFGSSGSSADGYAKRLDEVRKASADVDRAENDYKRTLLDTESSLDDVKSAHDRLSDAQKRHTEATDAERDAHRALSSELTVGQRVARAMSDVLPNLERNINRLATVSQDAEQKSTGLARGLSGVASVLSKLGPEAEGVAGGFELAAKGVDKFSGSAAAGGEHVRNFIRDLGGFEVAFGKISGLSLGLPALGGLGAIGGAAGVQGIVEVAESVRQLSANLALLPAVAGGAGIVMGTLKVALHGVGDAMKDMMADDPKKFLDDIKDMAPAAAHAMLQVAQFRDMFKLGGAAVQTSFFDKINGDIQPLIQTWLPALVAGGSKVAGVLGGMADAFAKLLMQPQMMQAFGAFIDNISKGLQAMQPAMKPLLDIFTQLSVVGSSFFQAIGGQITTMLNFFDQVVSKAAASGELQRWITEGINGIFHLINAVYSFGAAFNHIMDIAEKFGGGGLLAWIDQLGQQLNTWTQSGPGQKALTDFFTTLRQATDAFLPVLAPLLNGIVSIGSAFTQLGIATAPAWVEFFKTFAYEMQNDLGPAIVGMGPAINQFIGSMTDVFRQLMQTVGPQLPKMFQDLADAMTALVPQIPQLAALFINLVESVGPQLPTLFGAVTEAIRDLVPLMPTIVGFMRDFVSVITLLIQGGDKAEQGLSAIANGIIKVGNTVIDALESKLGKDLPQKAQEWGKSLVMGLIQGMTSGGVLGLLDGATGGLVSGIAKWFQSSPAKVGPFSGSGYTLIRGQKMVTDMAAGMASAQPAIESAARSTALAASRALSTGPGGAAAGGALGAAAVDRAGAPAPGGAGTEGGSLLPPWIARADTSILDRYLSHEFPKNRGLAGLAKDFGDILKVAQDGSNLLFQHVAQPLSQTLGLLGKIPSLSAVLGNQTWQKMTPQQIAERQQQELARRAATQGPTWTDVLGQRAAPGGAAGATAGAGGNAALSDALKSKGFSAQQIRLIQAFSQVEGNNPAGNPTLGFTDSQLGGATDLQSHVDALAKQFLDRSSVAGAFPEGGTDLQQAQWIAKVVGQSGLKSDWQGNAQPQDYIQRVMQAMGTLPGAANPTWQQVTGGGAAPGLGAGATAPPTAIGAPPIKLPPGFHIGHDGSLSYPEGASLPPGIPPKFPAGTTLGTDGTVKFPTPAAPAALTGAPGAAGGGAYPGDAALLANVPAGRYLQTQAADLTKGIGDCSSAVEDLINMMDGVSTAGRSLATSNAADWLTKRGFMPTNALVPGAFNVGFNDHHMQATLPGGTPFNWGSDAAAAARGIGGTGAFDPAFTAHYYRPVAGAAGGAVSPQQAAALAAGYPDVASALGQIKDNTGQGSAANQALLQAYLQGNPALASQIDAAKTPGAPDSTVKSTLDTLTTTINGLKAQDAIGNKNTIDALQSTQNQIAQQQGFSQQQGPAQWFSQAASGAGNIASSVIQTIQSGLDTLTATQDIADRLVYGVRNSEDIMKLIDDFQKYITFAANVANTVGTILSTAGSMSGGDASFGASSGLAAAGQIAQLISSVLQGINAGIDFAQQIYHIAGTYVGRFLENLTGLAGTPLMGDVHLELNKNTGQLIAYSADNPENKDYMNVPSFLNPTYDSGPGSNPNPQVNAQYNLYAGPGTSPAEMFSAATWMVNTGGAGGTGAMAAENF